jgi:hypothetical protein
VDAETHGIVTMLNGGRAPGLLNPEIYAEG